MLCSKDIQFYSVFKEVILITGSRWVKCKCIYSAFTLFMLKTPIITDIGASVNKYIQVYTDELLSPVSTFFSYFLFAEINRLNFTCLHIAPTKSSIFQSHFTPLSLSLCLSCDSRSRLLKH